jgi:hypothetical protein
MLAEGKEEAEELLKKARQTERKKKEINECDKKGKRDEAEDEE